MPYNPGQSFRGSDYLFQGISNAGASIGSGLANLGERIQKQKEEEKANASEFKRLTEELDALGVMTKDEAMVKDLDTLRGKRNAFLFDQQLKQRQQQMQYVAEQINALQAAEKQRFDVLGRQERFNSNVLRNPITPEALLRSAAESGVLTPEMGFRALGESGGVNWDMVRPREGKTTGGLPYLYGKGGQFQMVPNAIEGVDPQGNVAQGQERKLSDGTIQTWNGRAWVNSPRAQSPEQKMKLEAEGLVKAEAALQELERQIRRVNDRIELSKTDKSIPPVDPAVLKDLTRRRARISKLMEDHDDADLPTSVKAETPAAETPAAPTDPAQRKKDTVYRTPRGPMKWTGTGWVNP